MGQKEKETYHFIGIGGIGMSALARILLEKGETVQGSDSTVSYITDGLKEEGIPIFSTPSKDHVLETAIVVYSSAIREDHPEYLAAKEKNLPLWHRSELLKGLMKGKKSLLVAGSHGKTTTSSLLAHVLVEASFDPSYAIGGTLVNHKRNGSYGEGVYFVAEADESDGSFLTYPGFGAIVTNIEKDHLDFWKTEEKLKEGFSSFIHRIEAKDHLFWCADDPHLCSLHPPGKSYGMTDGADFQISHFRQKGWNLQFDLHTKEKTYPAIEVPLIGAHNALNAGAVFGLCLSLGIEEDLIRKAFRSFQGVKRRMEKKGEKRGALFFDDYAHHPTEIESTLKACVKAVGEKRLVVAFQPHRYTRTRDCWNEFLSSFSEADVLFLTDIYAAGEPPLPGITGEKMYQEIASLSVKPIYFVPRKELAEKMVAFLRPHDVVVTMGAGDITNLSKELLEKEIPRIQIGIIAGGKSAEHEISLRSTAFFLKGMNPDYYTASFFRIDREGYWHQEKGFPIEGKGEEERLSFSSLVERLSQCDICLPLLHGPFGEDGMVQGFLETLHIPYVGCDFRSAALTMDKAWTKRVCMTHGVQVAPFLDFSALEWTEDRERVVQEIEKNLPFPLFVKPVHLGSTVGVFRVETKEELTCAIYQVCGLDYKFLVEKEIIGREIEFGCVETRVVKISDPAEIKKAEKIHTYEGKYGTSPNPIEYRVPLPADLYHSGKEKAETVYRACGCSGLCRIDFFLTPKGEWILNEVNPMPGCTETSAFPRIWHEEEVFLSQLFDLVVISGFYKARIQHVPLTPPRRS